MIMCEQYVIQMDYSRWLFVIFVVVSVIIFLFAINRKKRQRLKRQVKNEGIIDFGNIVDSAFGAEKLYKTLIKKCHPDRFAPDEDKMGIANDITERLGQKRNDLKALNALKDEAVRRLNINL